MKQIDDQGYKDGSTAFNKGKTLRSLFEPMLVAMHNYEADSDKRTADEAYHGSVLIGFADALLTKLRSR